uniref:DUF1758 domain-containing protein n=1 Tax=Loa loa TaxID=7209 RepID=A0A1I7VP71_LOALO
MSASIIIRAKSVKANLEGLLDEVRQMDLTPLDQKSTIEVLCHQYETRARIIKEKLMRLERYVGTLEKINDKWLEHIQLAPKSQKKEEEEKYDEMANDDTGILNLINIGTDIIITLSMYKDDAELALKRLTQNRESNLTECRPVINLPQLSLPTFSGDPKTWREFWSGFEASVHSQNIPDIQKLNYLISCLKGSALQLVRGYDRAPENYKIIRELLEEKFGRVSTIRNLLYKELISTKRNDRNWRTTVEEMERVLRQLEAVGENVEQPTTETMIGSKLPNWILNQVMEWQYSDSASRKNLIKRHPNSIIPETSALVAMKQSKQTASAERNQLDQESPNWVINKKRRPCIFCNNNQWDSNCHIYPTVEQRIDRLKKIKVCPNCFKLGHSAFDCKKRMRVNKGKIVVKNANISVNSTTKVEEKRVLLLCKENPDKPEQQVQALVLFDISADATFISQKLAHRLNLRETDEEEYTISSFGNRNPRQWKSLIAKWATVVKDLPRFVTTVTDLIGIHVFTDVSSLAYSAAVYLVSQKMHGTKSSLIFSKSRIAPIKGMTIPRLELMAILIGTRAAQFVMTQLDLTNIKVILWSDSKCALHWIKNHSNLLPRFVQNRVEEIRRTKFTFRYIPSEENPVEVATRGLNPKQLRGFMTWWHGPSWLVQDETS